MTIISSNTRSRTGAKRLGFAGFALWSALVVPTVATAQTLVTIGDGDVQGQLNDGTREFLGIPYAAPPVGALRFSPPAPPAPWGSALDATTYPPSCAQLPTLTNSNTRVENEDCLYLNVWTPEVAPVEPLPVMIWIHGGSNTSGSTADFVPFDPFTANRLYDGHALSKNGNVIVVTINYRLNVFGFFGAPALAAEDPLYPYAGNQGLLDQRAAMLWVQDNIAAFGGDPGNVTIFGESAGSFDVCAHVASPMSEGLFHRAISQSGGCTVGVQSIEQSVAAADIITEAVGCAEAVDKMACLRAAPLADLLDASPLVGLVGESTNLALSVDGGFLPEHPRVTFDRTASLRTELPKVPYMLGSNLDEGTLFFIGTPDISEEEYSAELLSRFGAYAPQVEVLYPNSPSADTRKFNLINAVGDSTLVCSTKDVAVRYSRTKNKTFLYDFARVPDLAFINLLKLGAFHGLEIAYVFGSVDTGVASDTALSLTMQNYWSSFATKGKPKSKGSYGWSPFKEKSYKSLRLDSPIAKLAGYRRAKCDFWSTVYDAGAF